MNIDNWPLDRIMRLPDWCFGRRYWTGSRMINGEGGATLHIAEEHLPDKFVVWGMLLSCRAANCLQAIELSVRLGTQVPVNVAELMTLDLLLKNICAPGVPYELNVGQNGVTFLKTERMLIESAGRRLVFGTDGDAAIAYDMVVGVLISALPKEVPDWLVLGQGENPL